MKTETIQQKAKDGMWTDESGVQIPYNRITSVERLMERHSWKILKGAQDINKRLADFKDMIRELCQEAHDAFMKEQKIERETKGNFSWFNFNRSIKVEITVNEPIQFDDMTITAAKAKFDEFLNDNITSKNEFVKAMIIDAFETQRNGQLDTKAVMKITRYEKRINDTKFSEAVDLINSSIRRPKSKSYFRVSVKNEEGGYDNIDLNFSSI
ncbi:MAG: DUF3164 family protein [Flavobacteriaceae bacterium]|nr:DUF3164 family protein [Flavobacteriaceae bacterium]